MFDPGDVIDKRFKVNEEIGRGGMGIVLRVDDITTGQQVALKYCPDSDRDALRRFEREVCIAAELHHKHIMPVLDQNLSHMPPYFTMPVAAGSLEREIRRGDLEENRALDAFEQICLGVQAIHNAKRVHRDIKPENAMRMSGGEVVISDFGLVKVDPRDTTTLTQPGAFLGTRMYCAPEQLVPGGSRDADVRTDLYQLGKLLYEMITGEPPALINPDRVPGGLAYVIERATEQRPEERYQSVGALMDAVQDYMHSREPEGSPHHAFESALQAAEGLLKVGRYRRENLEALLGLLAHFGDDPETFLEQFDRVPNKLLQTITHNCSAELRPVLKAYLSAVDSVVGSYNFSYAETVAQKMRIVFHASDDASMKALAVRTTLIAAVDLNRYAAMDTFASLLADVEREEDAVAVAGVLREEMTRFEVVASGIPKSKLHPVILAVREQATAI